MTTIALYNVGNAGDMILSRPTIQRAAPLLQGAGYAVRIECRPRRAYLWSDLGMPLTVVEDGQKYAADAFGVPLWGGTYHDLLMRHGLAWANQVATYNRAADQGNLPHLDVGATVPLVEFSHPPSALPDVPSGSILVENGPALSGQRVLDFNAWLPVLGRAFPARTFYCAAAPPPDAPANVVSVSTLNLVELSRLSDRCQAQMLKLSGVCVACMTPANVGKPRFVIGQRLYYPIWYEVGFSYITDYEALRAAVAALPAQT